MRSSRPPHMAKNPSKPNEMLEESWSLVVNHVVKLLGPTLLAKVLLLFFWGVASTVRRLELEAFPVETGSHVGKLPPFWEKPPCEKPMSQKESLDKNDMFQTGKTHWGDKLWPSFPRDASFPSCFDDRRGYKADLTWKLHRYVETPAGWHYWPILTTAKVPQRNQNSNID